MAGIALTEGIDLKAYRETPPGNRNSSMSAPNELLMNQTVRTKLDHFLTTEVSKDNEVRE